MPHVDARGLAISTRNEAALEAFETALESLHASRGDVVARLERVFDRDPQFDLAQCLHAAVHVMSGKTPAADLVARLRAISQRSEGVNDRERRHAAAAVAFFDGDLRGALEGYGALVIDYPRDSLALQVAHALDFRLGKREMLRDRVAQALPRWDDGTRGFGYALAMYAFGLEENGDYAAAERIARRSLALVPDNAAAIHVLAHVMEMQGRTHEGLALLEQTRRVWEANLGFAVHIAWHLSLLQLDLDATGSALAIYDRVLAPSAATPANALVDASALLWRLTLRGVDVGSRWRVLAKHWKRERLAGQRAFNLVHSALAFAAAGRSRLARRVQSLLRDDPATRAMNTPDDLVLAVGVSAALQAFVRGDYGTTVERLTAVRAVANNCGGSVAQCDCIHLTLTEAALRDRRAQLARALAAERAARKPFSALNRWLVARASAFAASA